MVKIDSLPRFCLICMTGETSLNQYLLKNSAFLSARLCSSGNQGLGMGSAGLKVWVPWGVMLLPGQMILFSIHWYLRLPISHLRFFLPPGENSFLVLLLSIFIGRNFKYSYQYSNVCVCVLGGGCLTGQV